MTRMREEDSCQETNSDGLKEFFTLKSLSRTRSILGEEEADSVYKPTEDHITLVDGHKEVRAVDEVKFNNRRR